MPTMIILTVIRARAQIPVHTCCLTAWYMNLFVHSTADQPMTSRPAHPGPPNYLLCSISIMLLPPQLCPGRQEPGVPLTSAVQALCRGLSVDTRIGSG